MFSSSLMRGASACALILLASEEARAQQALPAIEIGAARRTAPSRAPAPNPIARVGAPTVSSPVRSAPAAPPAPVVASPFPSEPKTPAEGYVVRNVTSGTKTDIPARQIPVTVNVVPKQVLQDQNITTLSDAIENVPGIRSNNNELEGYNFKIRGFNSLYIYRNNLAIPGGEGNPSAFDTANLERIEVLKGPASVLFGRGEPGGLINLITKQPLDKPLFRIEQQIGSFDHYRTQWDVSTPIPTVPGLAARVSGAYQNNGSFRRFQGGERFLVAPVVSYRPSEWTEITLDAQFLGQKSQSDIGVPVIGPRPAPIPLSRSFQEPNDPRDRIESYNLSYTIKQNLNEDWKVTNRFLFAEAPNFQKPYASSFCTTPMCVDWDGATFNRIGVYQAMSGRVFTTNFDLNGKFTALGAKHDFLFGLDYFNGNINYFLGDSGTLHPINIFYPIYGTIPADVYLNARIGTGFKFHSSQINRQKAFYVQDHATWLDGRLHVLGGVRYDVADITLGQSQSFGGDYSASKTAAEADRLAKPTRVDTAWSPRAGLVYDLLPQLSAYGSYSRSFGINYAFDANGKNLGPQRGVQWEVGLKAEPLPGLSTTLAFFQITKSGVPVRDYASPDPFAQKLGGLQRSRGVEIDAIGRITDRLTVVGNYALLDAKVISDNGPTNRFNPFGDQDPAIYGERGGLLHNHLDNAPRHSGKIFLTYDFGNNGLGFRLGGGVTASSQAWGNIQNTFVLPGWARLDAFASYTTLFEGHKITAQLNLKNINNAQYYSGVDSFFNGYTPPQLAFAAPPFTAVGSLRFEW